MDLVGAPSMHICFTPHPKGQLTLSRAQGCYRRSQRAQTPRQLLLTHSKTPKVWSHQSLQDTAHLPCLPLHSSTALERDFHSTSTMETPHPHLSLTGGSCCMFASNNHVNVWGFILMIKKMILEFFMCFSPRVFPLRALSPCCTRSVGGSEGSRSKEPAGPWMPGSPFALEAAPLPRATEEKHRGLKSLTPSPFPEWSLGLIPSGFPCLAPEDITQLWLKWHPELADASSGISPSHSPLPAHLPLLLPQIPDFQIKHAGKVGSSVWGAQKKSSTNSPSQLLQELPEFPLHVSASEHQWC